MAVINASIHKKFSENVKEVSAEFTFRIPTMCMGRVDISAHDDGQEEFDEDIYNGTYITTHGGAARVAFHTPSETYCLISSKTAVNLRGNRDEDSHIIASDTGLSKSYILAAYRIKSDGSNRDQVKAKLSDALDQYNREAGKRSKKLFTQYAARFTADEPVHKSPDKVEFSEIFTNGYASYLVNGQKNKTNSLVEGMCSADFYVSVKRDVDITAEGRKERFVPMNFKPNFWNSDITKISKPLSDADGYASLRAKIDDHWSGSKKRKGVASRLWDQDSLYKGEGFGVFNRSRAITVNYINKHKKSVFATAGVAGVLFAINPAAGIAVITLGAAAHTLGEKLAHGTFDGIETGFDRVKRAQKRKNIEDYSFTEDCSDYFKIQTENNLSPEKIAPKMDMERFDSQEFVFEKFETLPLRSNMAVENGLRPEDIRSLLLLGHQRGFTSTVTFLDRNTRVDAFQNGIMRVMHKQLGEEGKVVVHAQYRPDLCTNDNVRLPQVYIDQFENGLIRMEYNPAQDSFKDSMKVEAGISQSQAVHEIRHVQLFRSQSYTNKEVKDRSMSIVSELFLGESNNYEGEITENNRYLSLNPFGIADAEAIFSKDTLNI